MATDVEIKRRSEGDVRFFFSENVKIFPCTYRGFYENDPGEPDRLSVVFDPESRLISEYNYTHLPGLMANKTSYVLEYIPVTATSPKGLLRFVIDGYYFEISDLAFDSVAGSNIYNLTTALAEDSEITDVKLTVCTRQSSLNQDDNSNADSLRYLTYLSSQYAGCSSLDQLVEQAKSADDKNIYYCTAVALHLKEDTSTTHYFTKSSSDSTLHTLYLKRNGKLVYDNFLSNLATPFIENYENNIQKNKEYANLELGYEATARGKGALAIGTSACTNKVIADASSQTIENTYDFGTAIGSLAKAQAQNAIALGVGATAAKEAGIAIGSNGKAETAATPPIVTEALGAQSIAIGQEALAEKDRALALGYKSKALVLDSIAIGKDSKASYNTTINKSGMLAPVALGQEAKALDIDTTAIGAKAIANSEKAVALGAEAQAKGTRSIAIGKQSKAVAQYTIALGAGAGALGVNSTVLGTDAESSGDKALSIGAFSSASATNTVAVGTNSKAAGSNAIALGVNATANNKDSIAIGAEINAESAIALGVGAKVDTDAKNAIVIGNNAAKKSNEILIGNGLISTGEDYSCILGNYNDASKKGQVCIATGTSDTDKRTSCVFGADTTLGKETHIYEKLTVDGYVKLQNAVEITDKLTAKGYISLGVENEAQTSKALLTVSPTEGSTRLANYTKTIDKDTKKTTISTSNVNSTGTATNLQAQKDISYKRVNPETDKNETVKESAKTSVDLQSEKFVLTAKTADYIDSTEQASAIATVEVGTNSEDNTSYIDLSADLINISANTALNLKYSKGEDGLLQIAFNMAHPINSIFQTVDPELNTAAKVKEYFENHFGVDSTWEAWGEGRVPLGASGTKYVPGSADLGGSETATLKTTELPSHAHTISCGSTSLGPFSHKVNDQEKTDEGWTLTTAESDSHSHTIPKSGAHVHAVKTDRGTSGDAEECFGLNKQAGSWRIWEFADKTDETGNKGNEFGKAQAAHFGEHEHTTDAAGTHTHTISLKIADHAAVSHNHTVNCDNAGEGKSFSIMQPYQVCYMWKRIS